jgi:hypothetical protein
VRASLDALLGLLRIRWNLLRGLYRSIEPVRATLEIQRFEPRPEAARGRQAAS